MKSNFKYTLMKETIKFLSQQVQALQKEVKDLREENEFLTAQIVMVQNLNNYEDR